MSTGRTTWRAKPCGWRDRERVVALGEEFGPGGPLVLDVLEEMAKEQVGDGTVRAGLRSLARAAFLPRGSEGAELVRNVLRFAETVGALDDLAIADDADMTVTCRVSGFAADQGKGYESVRKARQRGAAAAETTEADAEVEGETDPDHVPEAGTEGDNVPDCPPTGQDRTGHSSLRSENARQRAVRFRGRQVSATTTALAVAVVERKRSPATIPGYMAGRPAPSKGRRYPPTPFTVDEIVQLTNRVGDVTKNDIYAQRLRALILLLWRSGLRISEALALTEHDLNAGADLQAAARIRKRFRPHQLRHTLTCELILEGKNIVIVQRQLGHSNLAVTTNYTNGLPQSQVVDAMRGRDMPTLPAFGGGA